MTEEEFFKWIEFFKNHRPVNELVDIHLGNIEYILTRTNFETKKKLSPEDFMLNISPEVRKLINEQKILSELNKL